VKKGLDESTLPDESGMMNSPMYGKSSSALGVRPKTGIPSLKKAFNIDRN